MRERKRKEQREFDNTNNEGLSRFVVVVAAVDVDAAAVSYCMRCKTACCYC